MENKNPREQASEILAEMLRLLDIKVELTFAEDDEQKIDIKSEEAGRLIGRKGQYLENLELLLNRILRCQFSDVPSTPWIVLAVDGYCVPRTGAPEGGRRRGRGVDQERFQAIALDAAKEVKLWDAPRTLGPFRPAERRVIHMTLRNDEEVETISDAEADENGGKKITIRKK